MRHVERYQQSFTKGIVEGVAQHLLAPQEQAQSLLWLENYDPNIEIHSLVKRKANVMFGHGNPSSGPRKFMMPTEFTGIPANGLGNFHSTANLIYAYDILNTANPVYRKTFIVFGRRMSDRGVASPLTLTKAYPSTYLASTGYEYNSSQLEDLKHYQEAIADQGLHANLFPGWYTLGTYAHHWKYGESILFVTQPLDGNGARLPVADADKKYFAPVYKWYHWDITKKRDNGEKWWEGINFANLQTDKNRYTRWKVKVPSKIAFDDVVSLHEVDDGTLVPASTSPIQLVIAENNLFIEDGRIAPPSNKSWMPTSNLFEMGTDSTFSYPDIRNNTSIFAIEGSWLRSLHLPKIESYKQLVADRVNAGIIASGEGTFELGNIGIHLSNIVDDDVVPGRLIANGPAAIAAGFNHRTAFGGVIDRSQNVKTGVAGGTFDRYEQQSSNANQANLGFLVTVLPDYDSMGLPRPFAAGEEIPLVVTVEVDGNQIPIYKGSYVVRDEVETGYDKVVERVHVVDKAIGLPAWHFTEPTPHNSFTTDFAISDTIEKKNKFAKIWGTHGGSPYLNFNPVTNKYTLGKCISFTIRIDQAFFATLLDQDVTSISVYASRPSSTNSLLYSIGVLAPQEPPIGLYATPAVNDIAGSDEDTSYEGYGLVKKFLISGANSKPNYELYSGEPFNTNGWQSDGTHIWAVPVDNEGDPLVLAPPRLEDDLNADPPVIPNFRPDFVLWDYPRNSPPLNLQFSGKTWKGLGAKFVVNIKSLVLLGGCIDEYGDEEQALIRYCSWQNGVPLYDNFPLENFIKIGSLPHTAVVEFREQLVWFNRQAHYRMVMPEIFNPGTWEFLEAVEGGGTFSHKTVANTPFGLCYANEMGIWITEGTFPISLSNNAETGSAVTAIFQSLATNAPYNLAHLYEVGDVIIGTENFNEHSELLYDDRKNELIFSTPVTRTTSPMTNIVAGAFVNSVPQAWQDFTHEVKLIYNFTYKNWRAEVFYLRTYYDMSAEIKTIKTSSQYGRFKVSNGGVISMFEHLSPENNNNNNSYQEDLVSHYWETVNSQVMFDEIDVRTVPGLAIRICRSPIVGAFTTHVLGDNINDGLLRKVFATLIPRDNWPSAVARTVSLMQYSLTTAQQNLPTLSNKDPQLSYLRRNENWSNQFPTTDGWRDLVEMNMQTKGSTGINLFLTSAETPAGINAQNNPLTAPNNIAETARGTESVALTVPLNTPFRRLIFKFASEFVVKIHTLVIEYVQFKRKTV